MRCLALVTITGILLILAMIGSSDTTVCRDLSKATSNFTCDNFAGFYYDINHKICTESLSLRFSNVTPDKSAAILGGQADLIGMRGITYTTCAFPRNFGFKAWGQYEVINFLGKTYIAAYDSTQTPAMASAGQTVPFLASKSNNANLVAGGQISQVLMDSGAVTTVAASTPLKLGEGYQLAVKSVDIKGGKIYLELSKNGQVVDSKVIQPGITNAKMADQTYYYKKDIGGNKSIVIVAVHFKNVLPGQGETIDGVFQISDTPVSIKVGQQYDKMSIKQVDLHSLEITLDNKDNQITVVKNKTIQLFEKVYLQTSNQTVIDALHPLKYCIVKKA
jgi:S-layer protein (TIGR01567 family)